MSLFQRLFTALRSGAISEQEWDEIRVNLITADLGVDLIDQVITTAKSVKPEDAKTAISQVISNWLSKKDRTLISGDTSLKTILIVGVNGTGKTTSVAKIASMLKNSGNKVLLAAADTFRAAATDQLQTWAERIKTEIVIGQVNSDPASVAYSAVEKAKAESYDYLKNVVVNGDTIETMKMLKDESIHLTFTSPPYYNARDYSIYPSYNHYLEFLAETFKEVMRITKEGRFLVLNTSPIIVPRISRSHSSKRYPIPFDIHFYLMKMGWEFIDDIVWVKPEASVKNRIGGFMIAQVAKLLKENKVKLPFGLYITNSVQEEVGLRGAEMITHTIKPNLAIITDVCHDTQSPMMNKIASGDLSCGKGPVLTYGPAVQNNVLKLVIDAANKNKIPFQRAAASRATGTDTDAFAYSIGGVPSALISLPLRYMHTTVESVHKEDVENVIKLIYETLRTVKNNHDFKYIK